MCGRFFLDTDFMEIIKKYRVQINTVNEEISRPGEVFPGTDCLIIRQGVNRRADALHWGMPYDFVKQPIINVRTESFGKSMFYRSFLYRRCIIPANYYFEWKSLPGKDKKNKMEIGLEKDSLLSLGGIFQRFRGEDGKYREAFAILTTPAADDLRDIHHRMPLILNGREEEYLQEKEPEKIQRLIRSSQNDYNFFRNTPCKEQNFIV